MLLQLVFQLNQVEDHFCDARWNGFLPSLSQRPNDLQALGGNQYWSANLQSAVAIVRDAWGREIIIYIILRCFNIKRTAWNCSRYKNISKVHHSGSRFSNLRLYKTTISWHLLEIYIPHIFNQNCSIPKTNNKTLWDTTIQELQSIYYC